MALLNKLAGCRSTAEEDEIKSIVDNINHILGTTRDYGFFLHDYGISDYRYLGTRDDIAEAITEEITETIGRFEPRVVLKAVVPIDDDKLSRLSFSIDCEVRKTRQPLKLFLEPVTNRYQIFHD